MPHSSTVNNTRNPSTKCPISLLVPHTAVFSPFPPWTSWELCVFLPQAGILPGLSLPCKGILNFFLSDNRSSQSALEPKQVSSILRNHSFSPTLSSLTPFLCSLSQSSFLSFHLLLSPCQTVLCLTTPQNLPFQGRAWKLVKTKDHSILFSTWQQHSLVLTTTFFLKFSLYWFPWPPFLLISLLLH